MDRRPLIILGSARKESDTKKIVDALFDELDIVRIDLLDQRIENYNYEGNYSTDDNFIQLFDTILEHNKIVFATPVYWYSMSGIMKTFFDRLTDIITKRKEIGRKMKGKEIYVISVGADNSQPEGFEIPFRSTSEYLEMNFISTFYCKTNNLENIKADGLNFIDKLKSTTDTTI
jgi:multimeric flavodoxin WrbA